MFFTAFVCSCKSSIRNGATGSYCLLFLVYFFFARSELMALQNSVWFWSKVRLMRLLPASLAFRSSGCFMLLQKNLSITSGNTCRLWKFCLPAQARWTCCVLLFLTLEYLTSSVTSSFQCSCPSTPLQMHYCYSLWFWLNLLLCCLLPEPLWYHSLLCSGLYFTVMAISCFTLTKKPSELCSFFLATSQVRRLSGFSPGRLSLSAH